MFWVYDLSWHHIGSLVPAPDRPPKFPRLYTYGIVNDVDHQIAVFDGGGVDREIVASVTVMLNSCTELVMKFRKIQVSRKRIDLGFQPFSTQIVGPVSTD